MKKQLLIYIQKENPEKASWISIDETGVIQHAVVSGDLSDLSQFANSHDVCLIVPGEDVLLTQVTLPKLNRQRLLQAVPFTLEEKLIDDIQNLHFSIGDYQSNNTLPVAVVAKQKMEQWLNPLKALGLIPSRMLPSTLAIPHATICHHNHISIVRHDLYNGFVCDKEHLNTYLDLQNTNRTMLNEINLTDENILENMHQWILEQPVINLLQGPYQSRQKTTLTKKIWLGAAALASAWVLLVFLNNLVAYVILHQASNKTEQAINKIYKQHFPEATTIVAPRERIEAKLKKITAQTNKNDLLILLSRVGNSLNKTPDIHLQNLDFRDNRLNLTVLSSSFANLDSFTQLLKEQGLTIKQQSADMAGTQVKANIFINKGAS